jgi:hypothetical protein
LPRAIFALTRVTWKIVGDSKMMDI